MTDLAAVAILSALTRMARSSAGAKGWEVGLVCNLAGGASRSSKASSLIDCAISMGLITPPVGVCLFVTCKIGNITMGELWKDLRWFFLAEIGVLLLLCYFPMLSTGLPILIGR